MPPSCPEYRDRIIESAGSALDADLVVHVESCSACAQLAASVARQVRVLGSLARVPAPEALDGLVVASFHAGHRQQRARDALQALTRPPVPAQLDQNLWDQGPRRAPIVLDRLVSEELADPSKASSKRYAGRLERLSAPDELRQRLVNRQDRARSSRRVGWAAAALGVALVAFGALGVWQATRITNDAEGDRRIVVERVESLDRLDPATARAFAGIAGGIVELQRAELAEKKL